MKNFLSKLSETSELPIPPNGKFGYKQIFKNMYYKYKKAFVGIVLLLIMIPSILFARYGGQDGMIYSLILFSIIGCIGMVEVMTNLKVSRIGQLFITISIMYVILTPFSLINDLYDLQSKHMETRLENMLLASFSWPSIGILLGLSLVLIFDYKKYKDKKETFVRWIQILIVIFVTTIMIKTMFIMSVNWTEILITFLSVSILSDTFGTIGGSLFGKKLPYKLAPKLSPKKTWIGAIFGIIASVTVFYIVAYTTNIFDVYFRDQRNIDFWISLAAILLPIVSIIGDLFFSWIKRSVDIKDFSSLISGHGGIYDRMDSHSFVFTTLFLLFILYGVIK